MKKLTSIALAVAVFLNVIFSFFAVSFGAADIEKTQILSSTTYYEYNSATKTLTISGKGGVPNFSNNSSAIPWYELRQDGEIKNVVVEEGITSLGTYCLYQVKADSITLPQSLKSLGVYSLAYTTGLTNVELNFGLEKIGNNAFQNCGSLTDIVLPKTLTSIGSSAFQSCIMLRTVEIPYDIKSIGANAFSGCTYLENVKFQSALADVSIGNNAFLGCNSLNEITFPINTEFGTKTYGYKTSNTKNTSAKMYVFDDSPAYYYAVANSISYEIIDAIPMQCAALYRAKYTDYNKTQTYHFSFTAESDTIYNFYTVGDADVQGVLKDSDGNTVATADDISWTNRNFCISQLLESGKTYHLYVSSANSTGDFNVRVYPNNMRSMTVYGSVTISSDDGTEDGDGNIHYDIDDETLGGLIVEIYYSTGLYDKNYYEAGYFNRRELAYSDNQSETPFTCGENTGYITIANLSAPFTVNLTHTYEMTTVYPTFETQGYNLYTCKYCGDSYMADYDPKYITTVSGTAVLMENEEGAHTNNIPYQYLTVTAQGREYPVNYDGTFTVYLSYDGDITLNNAYGEDVTLSADTQSASSDLGVIALSGYDLNADGVVNAKDYALSFKQFNNTDIESYFSTYAYNFY